MNTSKCAVNLSAITGLYRDSELDLQFELTFPSSQTTDRRIWELNFKDLGNLFDWVRLQIPAILDPYFVDVLRKITLTDITSLRFPLVLSINKNVEDAVPMEMSYCICGMTSMEVLLSFLLMDISGCNWIDSRRIASSLRSSYVSRNWNGVAFDSLGSIVRLKFTSKMIVYSRCSLDLSNLPSVPRNKFPRSVYYFS